MIVPKGELSLSTVLLPLLEVLCVPVNSTCLDFPSTETPNVAETFFVLSFRFAFARLRASPMPPAIIIDFVALVVYPRLALLVVFQYSVVVLPVLFGLPLHLFSR